MILQTLRDLEFSSAAIVTALNFRVMLDSNLTFAEHIG